jgi:hypothetical protein
MAANRAGYRHGGAYMGVEVRMKWHWAEIQRAHARIDRHELKIENLEHA